MYSPIQDYAIIGNLRSAVLVSKHGSIDWAPAPFIDSPSVFAAMLDDEKGGFWSIQPEGEFTATQQYDGDTNILVTRFKANDFVATVTDFIPVEKERVFVPAEEDTTFKIHRKVSCESGVCRMRVIFNPQFDYARGWTELSLVPGGVYVKHNAKHGVLASRLKYDIQNNTATTNIELTAGDREFLVFRYNAGSVPVLRDEYEHHEGELQKTKAFWESWVHKCDVDECPVAGPWHGQVVRSSLALKILFFEPVGTIAAAPTTSLPETVGGVRNWDYRFSWIRDSAFTLSALFRLGYIAEAEEYLKWVVSTCTKEGVDPEHLQVLYGLRGETKVDEEILGHLKGYKNSKPVRMGNDAYRQQQWDIYGSIFDMVWTNHRLRENKHVMNSETWEVLRRLANYVVKIWREPDEGLWEVRTPKQHFLYSKVMCWVALDRALKIVQAHDFEGEVEVWKHERGAIKFEVLERGWNEKKHSFTQSFGSEALDAAVLTFPTLGFIDGANPKMLSTIDRIEQELGVGDGLLLRYTTEDGLPGKEGAFLFASFWLVDALVHSGQLGRAQALFSRLAKLCNHVGLLPEEIDPNTKDFLGNFPQAYAHIGFINSAFNISTALTAQAGRTPRTNLHAH